MKNMSLVALALVAATVLPSASAGAREIVVSPSRTETVFVRDVSRELDRQLQRDRSPLRQASKGYAIVRFRCSVDGLPEAISIYRSSGDRQVDRIALRAVERLRSLHPLPDGAASGQLIQANVAVAGTERALAMVQRRLARDEAQRLASAPVESNVIVLGSFATFAS